MKYNTRKNRQTLAQKMTDNLDIETIIEMVRDQFEIFLEDLSPSEFNHRWDNAFKNYWRKT